MTAKESISFDILIIGAGPAGLSAAIRLAQLAQAQQRTLSIAVLEKAAEVGKHSLSGAVLDPKALNELLPDWKNQGAPLNTPAIHDDFLLLSENKRWHLPVPSVMKNTGNYIISLGVFCQWLAKQAEQLGVSIFPGFAATEILYDEAGNIIGVTTGDKGVDKNGEHTSRYQPGMDIFAQHTLFAEGCRGSLTKTLWHQERFSGLGLSDSCAGIAKRGTGMSHGAKDQSTESFPLQTYGIGVKELWEIQPHQHKLGHVMHSVGWPLDSHTYGGSFLYHLDNNRIAVGMVIGLDYSNPYLDPFEELQRFKTHPAIRDIFKNGRRLEYGARALNEGGWQAMPRLHFPGGSLIGDCAGFMNVSRIKGIHTSMKSAMIAAELLMAADDLSIELMNFNETIKQSWVGKELYAARNIRPAFQWGLWAGLLYSGIDMYLLGGKAPWTLRYKKPDYQCLKPAKNSKKIIYPKPDNVLTFDKLSSVYLSNIHYTENQPCHLVLKNPSLAIDINDKVYDSPESRYCPSGVYEIVNQHGEPHLQINSGNCIQCKTCDIKDPRQNINWQPPEGGDGPNYNEM